MQLTQFFSFGKLSISPIRVTDDKVACTSARLATRRL